MRSNAGGPKKRPTRYGSASTAALSSAHRLHKKSDHAAARTAYESVLASDPGCIDALVNLGTLEALHGRARVARTLFMRAAGAAPEDARVARDVGIGLTAIGELDRARDALERAVTLDGELVGGRLHLSRVAAELGDGVAALEHAKRAVELAPHDASTHLELHRACFSDRSPEAAIIAAERALELAPAHGLCRYLHAAALTLRDRQSRALDHPAIPAGLAGAARYALVPREGVRFFATRHESLRFACERATTAGPVVELGVRFGVSTRVLARACDAIDAFDSFLGLPEAWQGKPAGAFSTRGEVPELPGNVRVHRGWFEDTLPRYARSLEEPLRLLHVDSDLYASAVTGLAILGPWLRDGTVIVFDQYIGNGSWRDDEYRAFQEAVAHHGWRYRYLAFSWITGQVVIRLQPR